MGEPLGGHYAPVESVAVSDDGRHVVSASMDLSRIWRLDTRECVVEPVQRYDCGVTSVVISGEGRHVVSESLDGTLRI